MNVVIIDDGVNERYFNLKPLKNNLEIDKNQKCSIRQGGDELNCSHGTICAAIILKYAPGADISSIKVLDNKSGRGMKEHLITALRWCLENHIQLINLSIGTTQFQDYDEIRSIIAELYRNGCIIVAAYDNRDIYTMPASIECTIGVKCNPKLKIPSYQVCESSFDHFVEASGEHEFIDLNYNIFKSPSANSYAAPYITAVIHNIMVENKSKNLKDIWKGLSKNKFLYLCRVPDSIDRAVVVDLAENELIELFYFSVIGVYNEKTINEMKEIIDYVNIVVLAETDCQMASLLHVFNKIKQYIRGIFCCFKSEHPNLGEEGVLYENIWQEKYYLDKYAFSSDEHEQLKETNDLTNLSVCQNKRTKINIDIPLIYIYGERNYLIKFLVDIENMFLKAGYAVKIIGQFQRAYLYGFEYIDCIESRRSVIHNVDNRYNPDIIICGIDSQIIVHDGEDMYFNLKRERQLDGQEECIDYSPDTIYNRIISSFE